jgi:hypothetical protein
MSRASIAIAVVVVCAASAASAKPRVALAAFDGDTKDHARHAVADVLDSDLAIVASTETRRPLSVKQMKKLSADLDVDAVVHGKLASEGDSKVLRFSLFVHGKKSEGFDVEYTSLKSSKFKRAVHDRLLEKLGVTKSDDEQPAVAEAPKHEAKKRTAHLDEEEPLQTHRDVVAVKPPASPHGADRVAVRLDVGGSMSSRSLTFASHGLDTPPPPYSNGQVPGARVAGELYPLAFGNPRALIAGLGVAGEYDKTVGLTVENPSLPGDRFAVDQHRWAAGARFRVGFGASPSPTVTVALDYGHQAFKLDRHLLAPGTSVDMPDTEYVGFEPGLDARVPVGGSLAFVAGARAILLRSAGQIQDPEQYGGAHVTGGRAMIGVDITVTSHIAVRVAGEAAELQMKFYGTGQQTVNRDGDPTTQDVTGATDKYLGGSATLAVYY